MAEQLIRGVKGLSYNPRTVSSVTVQTLGVWIVTALAVYCTFKAFGVDLNPAVALLGTMLISLSYILPAPPGYVGSFEAYWSLVFVGLGMPLAVALPPSLLVHLMFAIVEVSAGCLAMAWLGLRFEELRSVPVKES